MDSVSQDSLRLQLNGLLLAAERVLASLPNTRVFQRLRSRLQAEQRFIQKVCANIEQFS
jgi:hypothetical protein